MHKTMSLEEFGKQLVAARELEENPVFIIPQTEIGKKLDKLMRNIRKQEISLIFITQDGKKI